MLVWVCSNFFDDCRLLFSFQVLCSFICSCFPYLQGRFSFLLPASVLLVHVCYPAVKIFVFLSFDDSKSNYVRASRVFRMPVLYYCLNYLPG